MFISFPLLCLPPLARMVTPVRLSGNSPIWLNVTPTALLLRGGLVRWPQCVGAVVVERRSGRETGANDHYTARLTRLALVLRRDIFTSGVAGYGRIPHVMLTPRIRPHYKTTIRAKLRHGF